MVGVGLDQAWMVSEAFTGTRHNQFSNYSEHVSTIKMPCWTFMDDFVYLLN